MKPLKTLLASTVIMLSLTTTPTWAMDLNFVSQQHHDSFSTAIDKGDNLDKMVEIYQKYSQQHPSNPSVLAYYGSLMTKRGDVAWFPLAKIKLSNEGLDILDKALMMAEDDTTSKAVDNRISASLEAKVLAVINFLNVPNVIFQRRAEGMDLAKAIVNLPEFQNKDFGAKAKFLAKYAQELADDNKLELAKKYAQQSLDAGATGKDAKRANEALNAKPVGQ